ncbi:DNA-deoxyinosine glycosylase [Croceibacterium ferulae]|uniref:DNA-deoxyinosine glycosylase n=1 Tax=Croceibacterium ferulae TaxID=1854641 RepID=UPI001F4EF394|nr:DNA-deoxyinosine glycosylase [Croceibacterium ferulae]
MTAPDTRLLILGSLPGERSLAQQRYYAHPQNRFWHLVGHAIGADLSGLPYEQRLATLLAHGIGLWDVVASATRTNSSLDAAIRDVAANPLAELAATLPRLQAVAFNGGTAARIGAPLLEGSGLSLLPLPSSSPAYAAMPLAEKERRWQAIGKFVGSGLPASPRQSI